VHETTNVKSLIVIYHKINNQYMQIYKLVNFNHVVGLSGWWVYQIGRTEFKFWSENNICFDFTYIS